MNQQDDHGLHRWMIGAALLLTAIVVYYGVQRWLNRPGAPLDAAGGVVSTTMPAAKGEQAIRGASGPQESVSSIPPLLLIHKKGKASRPWPSRNAPPSPPIDKKK